MVKANPQASARQTKKTFSRLAGPKSSKADRLSHPRQTCEGDYAASSSSAVQSPPAAHPRTRTAYGALHHRGEAGLAQPESASSVALPPDMHSRRMMLMGVGGGGHARPG